MFVPVICPALWDNVLTLLEPLWTISRYKILLPYAFTATKKMYVPSRGAVNFPVLRLYTFPLLVTTWGNTKICPCHVLEEAVTPIVNPTRLFVAERRWVWNSKLHNKILLIRLYNWVKFLWVYHLSLPCSYKNKVKLKTITSALRRKIEYALYYFCHSTLTHSHKNIFPTLYFLTYSERKAI